MNKHKTNNTVNGTMDTGCSLGQQREWAEATHTGRYLGG